MASRSKVEDVIGAISDPLSRGRAPRPAYPHEEELPAERPERRGTPEEASATAGAAASPHIGEFPQPGLPGPQPSYRRPRPPKRTPPRTREEVFRRLEGPRVLENYPIGKRFYLDEQYIAILDELAARFGQTHSEIVRTAIALLYIEATARPYAGVPGRGS